MINTTGKYMVEILNGGKQKNRANQKKQTTQKPSNPLASHVKYDSLCHNYRFASLTLAQGEVNSQSI